MEAQHTVLYRKYRPQTFQEVFGQDHIVRVLQGSLEQQNIGHAYLFSGPRGTGKTTMARILARELQCDPTDVIEIDAASNRGIDDIRQLRDGVRSLPFNSKYKMYIIDEVHMLTKEAFNALLKTLEEPPVHVIFVLATTELHKVLPTIISRCQSFIFKSPSRSILKEMITGIVKEEGFEIDRGALDIIAMLGNGSFRDTQGVLQKLTSYSKDKNITRAEVELVTGVAQAHVIHNLLLAINDRDGAKIVDLLAQAQEENIDAHILLQMLVESLRHVLYMRFSEERKKELASELDPEDVKVLNTLATQKNNLHSTLLHDLLKVYEHMSFSYSPYLPLEVALIRIIEEHNV